MSAALAVVAWMVAVREDVRLWFQGFGRYLDEETRVPTRGPCLILQRRMFEHYRRCLAEGRPCRMVVLKYRRAAASTGSTAIVYHHAQNFRHRCGLIGTDYKASSNMMEMVKTFGRHDDFPGWGGAVFAQATETTEKVIWDTGLGIPDSGESGASADNLGRRRGAELSTSNAQLPTSNGGGAGENAQHSTLNAQLVPWRERVMKEIATKIQWPDGPNGEPGARVELYTAENPESARSAGLQCYLATEVGRWPKDGAQEGGKTLVAMRNTLPKKGFHVAIEESTADGAIGVFYQTCRTAQWPEYDDYWKQWASDWPLARDEIGGDLQFVLIFAAWFEDARNFVRLTAEQAAHIEATLDLEPDDPQQPSYEGERDLLARYGQDGPKGKRLGGEVEATVWEQLAWRRMMIKSNGGLDNFKVEYPSNPLEAFRASGSPVFDQNGLTAIEVAQRLAKPSERGEHGVLDKQPAGGLVWRRAPERESVFTIWEQPREGARYLVTVDPMSGCELVAGSNTRDRHAVFVLRDTLRVVDGRGQMADGKEKTGTVYPVKVVARVRPPCQWDNAPLARQVAALSKYYGGAPVVVESNMGVALIQKLQEMNVNLYFQQDWIAAEQKAVTRIGWRNEEGARRMAVEMGREYVRERKIDIPCPHLLSEMKTFVFDKHGKAIGAGGNHDDDVLALCIGLVCLPAAKTYTVDRAVRGGAADEGRWKAR